MRNILDLGSGPLERSMLPRKNQTIVRIDSNPDFQPTHIVDYTKDQLPYQDESFDAVYVRFPPRPLLDFSPRSANIPKKELVNLNSCPNMDAFTNMHLKLCIKHNVLWRELQRTLRNGGRLHISFIYLYMKWMDKRAAQRNVSIPHLLRDQCHTIFADGLHWKLPLQKVILCDLAQIDNREPWLSARQHYPHLRKPGYGVSLMFRKDVLCSHPEW